ncbi:unnamed protein product [Bursaphelenchus xylophilus]|uniref:(pine wood nematode) hypothetical protein n=1 Tax=Bursaphelenchus xylophilus TaxID=6326 RepID=A0A7I8XAB0_BURXY|nr:unnamed protein product [Bursaphelenchus xylophilus]CAG9132256.1 unnamed protein product [Bursaphelenchus xylophilus]
MGPIFVGFLFIRSELKATEGRILGWTITNNDKDQDVMVLSVRYGPSGMRQIGDVSWSNLKRMECGKIDASTSRLEKSLKAELSIAPGAEGHMLETT